MNNIAVMSGMLSKMYDMNLLVADNKDQLTSILHGLLEKESDSSVKFCDRVIKKLDSLEDNVIYEYRSRAGLSLIIFKWCNNYVILTPFFNTLLEDISLDPAEIGFPKIDTELYEMQYFNFPHVSGDELIRFIRSIIETLTPRFNLYGYVLDGDDSDSNSDGVKSGDMEVGKFKPIELKYVNEREFMNAIESGDIQRSVNALYMMNISSQSQNIPFIREKNVEVSNAILRTLCKISAYNAGVTPAVIEEISARYNLSFSKKNKYSSLDAMKEQCIAMIGEYCTAVSKAKNNTYSPIIKYVVDYIELNYAKQITLDDIAQNCGISRNYLPHAFKKETGKSVVEYITDFRLEKAAKLLKTTTMSVQDIGNKVGYSDNNYFTKTFRKRFGDTPTKYRKKTAQE